MEPFLPMASKVWSQGNIGPQVFPVYAEMKYEGERLQIHKNGDRILFFDRHLRPINREKMEEFEQFIPEAFPHGRDFVLDAVLVLIDSKEKKQIPFKFQSSTERHQHQHVYPCLYIVDCLRYDGVNIMSRTLVDRKKLLADTFQETPYRIRCSNKKLIETIGELKRALKQAEEEGIQELILKHVQGAYEPGQRDWIRVRTGNKVGSTTLNPLNLVVLGAFYDNEVYPSKFLLGCQALPSKKWCTVTAIKVPQETSQQVATQINFVKINRNPMVVPSWLNVTQAMTPDFVCDHPIRSQVWTITGSQLMNNNDRHTAEGIGIRSPSVVSFAPGIGWNQATKMQDLKEKFNISRELNSSCGI